MKRRRATRSANFFGRRSKRSTNEVGGSFKRSGSKGGVNAKSRRRKEFRNLGRRGFTVARSTKFDGMSSKAATAPLRERVRAFPFDSLRRRLPFRRGRIGSGKREVGSVSEGKREFKRC